MRFKKLSASSFGRFTNWKSPELTGDILIVHGKNESGKTTLFKLISTILYGWDPVTDNPYVPWDKSQGECEATLSLEFSFSGDSSVINDIKSPGDSSEVRVIRKLKSRPEGLMFTGDKKYELGNRAVSHAARIPEGIFKKVYMLSVDELRFPDEKTWENIQDELLGGQFRSILKPVGEVVKGLEDEASGLWRQDKRGNPKDKVLGEQQKDLRARLKKAEENEDRLFNLEEEIEALSKKIESLEDEKLYITKHLGQSERLYPVYKKLRKIDNLLEKCDGISSLDNITEDPEKAISENEEAGKALLSERQKLLAQKEEIEKAIMSFGSRDRAVLSCRDEIEALVKSYSQVEGDKAALYDIEKEIERCRDRITYKAKDLLEGGWQEEAHQALQNIDEASLRASIEAYKNIDYKYREEELKASTFKNRAGAGMSASFVLLSVILLILGGGGILLSNSTPLMLLSGIVCLAGLSLLIIYIASKNNTKSFDQAETIKHLGKISEDRKALIERIKDNLKGLPIAAQRLADPGESLLVDVNVLKDLSEKLDDAMAKRSGILKRLRDKARTAAAVCEKCSLNIGQDLLTAILGLEKMLKEAEERFSEYNSASSRLDEVNKEIEKIENELTKAKLYMESILSSLEKIDGADLGQKIQNLKEQREDFKRAQVLKNELMHDYIDLDEIESSIEALIQNDDSWIFDDEKLAEAKVKRESIEEKLKELREAMGSLREEFKARQKDEKPDDIKGQIDSIEMERKYIKIKRDRLTLLKNIIIEADRSFREENQPDVLRRAGEYISLITDGRYTKIYTDDEGMGLEVEGNYTNDILDVEKKHLSRGTKEQIYLSLRLALMDHLDFGGERFPLFLDEAMVDWDSTRLESTINLLDSISKNRQVFIFTCSKGLCSLFEDRAQIIYL